MRISFATLVIATALASLTFGQDEPKAKIPPVKPGVADRMVAVPARLPSFSVEREAAAVTFVKQHHPELATLLETLKPMSPSEYRQAIRELFQVSEQLATIKDNDPRRYEINLDAWKAKSRVELLTAQYTGTPTPELESQLRLAIETRIDVELRRKKLHLEDAEANAERLRKAIADQEKTRASVVEATLRTLQRKTKPDRRQDEGKSAPVPVNASPAPLNNGGKAR